jgi:hypothetical protein
MCACITVTSKSAETSSLQFPKVGTEMRFMNIHTNIELLGRAPANKLLELLSSIY